MWKKNQDLPEEGGVRIPDHGRFGRNAAEPGEIHVESVKDKARHQIIFTAAVFILLFCIMTVSVCHYAIVNQRRFFDNEYNRRELLLEEHNRRGTIYSTGDYDLEPRVLAESDNDNVRTYPFGELFCHVVGYSVYDGSGLEDYMRYELMHSDISFGTRLEYDSRDELYPGNDVYTTLDPDLQKYAYEGLEGYRGAVLITEARTGKIRAMVSRPGFDPGDLDMLSFLLNQDESETANLLNRVTQGAYPPGSTFKILDAIELLREDPSADQTFSFDCVDGVYGEGEVSIHCFDYEHHHEQNLGEAFAHSCNSAFAKIVAEDLDREEFRSTLRRMMFNQSLPYDLPSIDSSSQLLNEENISDKELLQVAIGQGSTLVSPLHMNMITMAVANEGVLMRPYLVDSVVSGEGTKLQQKEPVREAQLMDAETAGKVRELMRGVTNVLTDPVTGENIWGTASEFNGTRSYMAYGKTGTAEFGTEDDSHAWFTGFTVEDQDREKGPADLCITVLIENGGVGSDKAVPVAKSILDRWYGEYGQ